MRMRWLRLEGLLQPEFTQSMNSVLDSRSYSGSWWKDVTPEIVGRIE
jgi:hypothetical protein